MAYTQENEEGDNYNMQRRESESVCNRQQKEGQNAKMERGEGEQLEMVLYVQGWSRRMH